MDRRSSDTHPDFNRCIHCGSLEDNHTDEGEPNGKRCPAANMEFPYHLMGGYGKPAKKGFIEEAEKYWSERGTRFEPMYKSSSI